MPVGSPGRSRLRVVHVVETMDLGGMERMIATLASATNRDRFDVQVLCVRSVGAVGIALAQSGIPVHFAALPGGSHYLGFVEIAREIEAMAPDVVHTHNTHALLYGALGARFAGVRHIVHTEHGRKFPDLKRYMLAERVISTFVQHVVGVSEAMTVALNRHVRIPRRKLRTIPNGVEPFAAASVEEQRRVRSELDIPDGAKVVGTVSRLVWEKGLDTLVRAWSAVIKGEPAAMLLVAGDGPERAALESLVDSLSLRASIRFLGVRSDVPLLLRNLDLFVMPSVSEGLPLALLEAMSAGLPIVATDVGGMPDALAHGAAGVVVPPGDPDTLAAAIIAMLGDPSRARKFGAEAETRFRERYTASAMAKAYEALYVDGGFVGTRGANA